jgi:hypothetical protein
VSGDVFEFVLPAEVKRGTDAECLDPISVDGQLHRLGIEGV